MYSMPARRVAFPFSLPIGSPQRSTISNGGPLCHCDTFEGFLPVGESSPPDPPPGRFQRPKSAPSIAHRWALACLRRRAPPWTSWGAGKCWLARWLLCSRCAGAPASATCKVPQHGALRGVLLLNQEQLLVSSRLPLRWPFSGLWIDVPPALSGSAMS